MRTLSLALLVLTVSVARAQDAPAPPTPAALAADLARMLDERVGLTSAQAARVEPVLRDHAERVVPLIGRGGMLALLRARGRVRAANRETDAALRPLLTAEQLQRYGGFLDDAMDHVRRRRGGG